MGLMDKLAESPAPQDVQDRAPLAATGLMSTLPATTEPAKPVAQNPGAAVAKADPRDISPAALESVIAEGDLSKLSPTQRVAYYRTTCAGLGLNPLSKPFEYLKLNGKLIMYANKECAAQLAKIHNVSVETRDFRIDKDLGILLIKTRAFDPSGRYMDNCAASAFGDKLKGELAAVEHMKCQTKANRRAVLGFCGLGLLDESEVDTIHGAQRVTFDDDLTGITPATQETPRNAPRPAAPAKPSKPAPVQAPAVVDAEVVEQAAAAPAPTPVERPAASPVEPAGSVDPDVFAWEGKDARQWLIDEIKQRFPGISRENLIKIAQTYQHCDSKKVIVANLNDMLAAEKAMGADSKILVQK